MIESQETVVDTVHAQLGANLSNFDALQRHVRLSVAQLNDKRENAAILSLGLQLRHHHAMVRRVGH